MDAEAVKTLAAGIPFAKEALKWLLNAARRLREVCDTGKTTGLIPADFSFPEEIIDGVLEPLNIDREVLAKVGDALDTTLKSFTRATADIDSQEPTAEALKLADDTRNLIEPVVKQRITFKGEQRPPSGPAVIVVVNVSNAEDDVIGVEIGTMSKGEIDVTVTVESAKKRVIGAKINQM